LKVTTFADHVGEMEPGPLVGFATALMIARRLENRKTY
jgi:hypothetical protein